jgi:hypothetical protein
MENRYNIMEFLTIDSMEFYEKLDDESIPFHGIPFANFHRTKP